jgi:DNA repair exonuclease SbcCD ATPase subunit
MTKHITGKARERAAFADAQRQSLQHARAVLAAGGRCPLCNWWEHPNAPHAPECPVVAEMVAESEAHA